MKRFEYKKIEVIPEIERVADEIGLLDEYLLSMSLYNKDWHDYFLHGVKVGDLFYWPIEDGDIKFSSCLVINDGKGLGSDDFILSHMRGDKVLANESSFFHADDDDWIHVFQVRTPNQNVWCAYYAKERFFQMVKRPGEDDPYLSIDDDVDVIKWQFSLDSINQMVAENITLPNLHKIQAYLSGLEQ